MANNLIVSIKDELAFIVNTILSESGLGLRQAAKEMEGVTPSLLSRVNNYKLEGVTVERLLRLINQVELLANGSSKGVAVNICTATKTISISFHGLVVTP